MTVCALCGDSVDDNDIINNLCSECFEIFGNSPNGTPTDMSEKITAAADSVFKTGLKVSYWDGPTATVANGSNLPIFVAVPTREQETLGSSASIYTRINDEEITIDNPGIHCVTVIFDSSKSDTMELKIDGVTWIRGMGQEQMMTMKYLFTGGESLTVLRAGSGTAVIIDATISIQRMTDV